MHPKASHHCFAYRIGMDGSAYRVADAGEPSGTAGRPILGQIDSKGLTNVLVVVVRYFGGTLLGVPGLIHAYKQTAIEALQQAVLVDKTVTLEITATVSYDKMGDLMKWVKDAQFEYTIPEMGETFSIDILLIQRVYHIM
jgi:putative IMPACT (imprinted ancient) family translation regulator